MQIESNELGFWSLKSSLLDSSLLHWNQVHYTRFIRDPTSHCFTLFFGHVDIILESNGLEFYIHVANSIFMNDHQPFHMWHCGSQLWPFFPFTCLTKSLQLSHPLFNSYNLLHSVIIFLSSHTLSHNTHLNNTLSQVMFLYIFVL